MIHPADVMICDVYDPAGSWDYAVGQRRIIRFRERKQYARVVAIGEVRDGCTVELDTGEHYHLVRERKWKELVG